MSFQSASTVRAAPLRRAALSLAKTCWVEVGRVRWKIAQGCAGCLDRFAHAIDLVGAQVVHEDDVVFVERRCKNLLDIGEERRAIHGAVDDVGRSDAIDAQRGNERHRLPMAMRHLRNQALAARTAPVVADHLGGDRCLIDEDETRCFEGRLLGFQLGTCGGDIRTILFGGVQSFF